MKTILTVILISTFSFVGCKGKDGEDGVGGSGQSYSGTIQNTPTWSVQVDDVDLNDTITVYYNTIALPNVWNELGGQIPSSPSDPYYTIGESGTGYLVRMHNLELNASYRIVVWRALGAASPALAAKLLGN